MRRVLYYEEKLSPQSPPLPFSSISSTSHSFFPKPSLPFPSKLANKALVNNDSIAEVETLRGLFSLIFFPILLIKVFFLSNQIYGVLIVSKIKHDILDVRYQSIVDYGCQPKIHCMNTGLRPMTDKIHIVIYGLAQNPPCHKAMATKGQH